jgi:hypothetical protein
VWAIVVPYVQARAIMQRLDAVCGAANWQCRYDETSRGFLGALSIRPDPEDAPHEWITKSDGADLTDIEPTKGGISGALKRAGVLWGIGRYLYDFPQPMFATIVAERTPGAHRNKLPQDKGGDAFWWTPPEVPEWALPEGYVQPKAPPAPAPQAQPEAAQQDNPEHLQQMGDAWVDLRRMDPETMDYKHVLAAMRQELGLLADMGVDTSEWREVAEDARQRKDAAQLTRTLKELRVNREQKEAVA